MSGTRENSYPNCVKCSCGLNPQDSVGWEKITDTIWLCPACISDFEYVKNLMRINNEWQLTIKKADNGFILESHTEGSDGDLFLNKRVIEEDDGELEAMKDLLWAVKEHFGTYWNKHNKKNLNIKIEEEKEDPTQ